MIIALILVVIVISCLLLSGSKKKGSSRATHTTHSSIGNDYVLYDKGEDILRHAPKPVEGLGFANFPEYRVSGKRATTNRKNTRVIRVSCENDVRKYAIETEGLVEPLTISVEPFKPGGPDLEYDLKVPVGASFWDAQVFEWSCCDHDTKHIPSGFMEYLTERGIPMSWLCGRNSAAQKVIDQSTPFERAVLYGYAVHCSMLGVVPGNVDKSPNRTLYTQFATTAQRDNKIMESISKRPGSDIWLPNKQTIAYKFALSYFTK